MHNYYMWHGGNHYGNWSLAAEDDAAHDGPTAAGAAARPFSFGVAASAWVPGHPASLGGAVASTNTQRYANAAPMHSDGTRNEPRWSHLAALQNLIRNHTEAMLTTSGVAAGVDASKTGCSSGVQCVVYTANTSAEVTFAIGGATATQPDQFFSIYGQMLGMPSNTVLIIAGDRKTVLWNSSNPVSGSAAPCRAARPAACPAGGCSRWVVLLNSTPQTRQEPASVCARPRFS